MWLRVICDQSAGAAEASLSSSESACFWSQARKHAAHVPAILPVPGHTQLSRRYEERGITVWPLIGLRYCVTALITFPLSLFLYHYSVFQLLSSMTECLCVDVQSLGVWRQLYTKHLSQSRWVEKLNGITGLNNDKDISYSTLEFKTPPSMAHTTVENTTQNID